jgi:cyclopropane fatty-acyl-phospholipid synthase-like methyltransferase
MSDWTAGYSAAANISYIFGYYPEFSPLSVKLAFLNAGLALPDSGTACELGYGHGVSVNMHAAASQTEWWGTDFSPSQAKVARQMAAACESGAHLFDEAFEEFCSRPDLPDFDHIGLHGIWSWISDKNRAVLVEFFRRKLKVGGSLYISYNTMPGWASFAPVRHLLTQYAETMTAPGRGIVDRVDEAIDFTEKLFGTNPLYVKSNPQLAERLKRMKKENHHYLVHEYFNSHWHPMPFAQMAESLNHAKLAYACPARCVDHVDSVNLTSEQQNFLNDIPDSLFRETVRDFMVNEDFRRDYWVKGAIKLSPLERTEALRAHRIILITDRADVSLKINAALGQATMNEKIYTPILDVLADYQPKTLGEIEQAVKVKDIHFPQVVQAALLLIGSGQVRSAQHEAVAARVKDQTDKLNAHLMNKARTRDDIRFLASPVTGGAVSIPRISQLFLLARAQGRKEPADWASFVWQLFSEQGHRVRKDGKRLEAADDNLAELNSLARIFVEKRLPVLTALGIAE